MGGLSQLMVRYTAARAQSNFSALPDRPEDLTRVHLKVVSGIYSDCTHVLEVLDDKGLDKNDAQLVDINFDMVRAVVALDYKTSLDRFQRDLLALKATGGLISKNNEHESLSTSRSDHMHAVAAGSAKVGVWKVGDKHAEDMEKKGPRYTVTRAKDFDSDVKATFGEVGQTPEEFEFELGRRVTSGFGPSDPTAPYHRRLPHRRAVRIPAARQVGPRRRRGRRRRTRRTTGPRKSSAAAPIGTHSRRCHGRGELGVQVTSTRQAPTGRPGRCGCYRSLSTTWPTESAMNRMSSFGGISSLRLDNRNRSAPSRPARILLGLRSKQPFKPEVRNRVTQRAPWDGTIFLLITGVEAVLGVPNPGPEIESLLRRRRFATKHRGCLGRRP